MSEQQNQQTAALGTAPVGPLLFRLALPTITAQVVNLLYSIVDRIYIGRIPLEGKLALTRHGRHLPCHHAHLGVCGAHRHGRCTAGLHRARRKGARPRGTHPRNVYSGALGACTRADSTVPAVSGAITETVRRICRHPAVCDAVPQPLRSRHGFRDDIARSERLHHRAGPLLGCDENRCHRRGAQHGARPAVHLRVPHGRARRGCGDNYLAGGVCGMGSAVSNRKADGSALKTRVFPHRPTGSGIRSRSGRVPVCHAVHRKPAHHCVQRIAAKVRRRCGGRRNDHPHLGGADGTAAADRTRAGRAAHPQLRLRREAADRRSASCS